MNEKHLSKLCLCIILISFLMILPFGTDFFQEKSVQELLEHEGSRGTIFGRVEYIISEKTNTIFIVNDGTQAKVFSPKNLNLQKNDFVRIYGESKIYNGEKEIHAYYVVTE